MSARMPPIPKSLRADSRAVGIVLALALSGCLSGCARDKAADGRIYVSDERGDAVVSIDPATGAVAGHIAAGRRPRGIALSPDGGTLYVAVSGSPIGGPGIDEATLPPADHRADGIAVIDVASGKVARLLAAGHDPETFALSRDGRTIFVSNEDDGAVSAVSVDDSRAPLTTKVGEEPEGVAISANGAHLFVACEASDHVAMLDARSLRLIRTVAIAGRPRGLLAAREGETIFVTAESGGKLALLAANDGHVLRTVDLARGDEEVKPMGMVEGADGRLFVSTGRGGGVIEVDPNAGTITRRIEHVGARPWGIALTGDGRTLVTANGPSGDVSLIDRAAGKVVRKLNVGKGPWGIAMKGEATGS